MILLFQKITIPMNSARVKITLKPSLCILIGQEIKTNSLTCEIIHRIAHTNKVLEDPIRLQSKNHQQLQQVRIGMETPEQETICKTWMALK